MKLRLPLSLLLAASLFSISQLGAAHEPADCNCETENPFLRTAYTAEFIVFGTSSEGGEVKIVVEDNQIKSFSQTAYGHTGRADITYDPKTKRLNKVITHFGYPEIPGIYDPKEHPVDPPEKSFEAVDNFTPMQIKLSAQNGEKDDNLKGRECVVNAILTHGRSNLPPYEDLYIKC